MQSTRDLGGTPSLVNTQIGDDIRNVPTPVTIAAYARGCKCCVGTIDSAYVGGDTHTRETKRNEIGNSQSANGCWRGIVKAALADDLCHAAGFGGQRGRPAVAELRSISKHFLTAVAGIGAGDEAQIIDRCIGEEVKERLCAA